MTTICSIFSGPSSGLIITTDESLRLAASNQHYSIDLLWLLTQARIEPFPSLFHLAHIRQHHDTTVQGNTGNSRIGVIGKPLGHISPPLWGCDSSARYHTGCPATVRLFGEFGTFSKQGLQPCQSRLEITFMCPVLCHIIKCAQHEKRQSQLLITTSMLGTAPALPRKNHGFHDIQLRNRPYGPVSHLRGESDIQLDGSSMRRFKQSGHE